MDFWATEHYTWIYKTVRDRLRDIGNIMFKHTMIPTVRTQQTGRNSTEQKETKSDEYNSELAKQFGADDYGMKTINARF